MLNIVLKNVNDNAVFSLICICNTVYGHNSHLKKHSDLVGFLGYKISDKLMSYFDTKLIFAFLLLNTVQHLTGCCHCLLYTHPS